MSYDLAARPSSSHSLSRPTLPPFLHLIPQENIRSSDRPRGLRLTIKGFSQTLRRSIFPGQSGTGTVHRFERTALEDENAVCITRAANSTKRRNTLRRASQPSMKFIISQSTASHTPTPPSSRALITSFPPLNASDIPPRSPTNKSPFSAILLSRGDEEREEERDPEPTPWHAEQLHRARLAKLTRHLGEEIPAELVLGPTLLSHGVTPSAINSHRGGHHHKRRSLDPGSTAGSTGGTLRRSKSLKEQDRPKALSMTGVAPMMPSTGRMTDGGVCNVEIMTHTEPIPDLAPAVTAIEGCCSTSPMDTPKRDHDSLHERVSTDTCSDNPPNTSHPPAKPSATSSFYASCATYKSRTFPRRPSTADASRRVEKLANFFGVARDDLSAAALRGTTQKLQSSSISAARARNFTFGTHLREPQLGVEVKVSKPTRFWNGRVTTKNIHPDDVMDQLRMMRAS